MKNKFMKMCSILLVVVLLFNMLPHRALADMLSGEEPSLTPGSIAAGDLQDNAALQKADVTEAEVVGEVTEKRTEFSKEFRLSNGLHMAIVYPDAVHYEADNGWEEIDNTLTAKADGTVVNTAGVWDISFPQQLSTDKYVTVSKDGYTLRFGLGGVLSSSGTSLMRAGSTLSVQQAQAATAQVKQLDTENTLTGVKHPETIATKLNARLQYNNVYSNTNVVYDLQSNKLKESVVINRYDSGLRGYRYTLDVGKMVPVLQEDNSILFYDEDQKNVVMVMPAPFMVDAEKAYNYDVEVVLQGAGSSYTLQYLLPQQWLAAEERAWPVVLDPVVQPSLDTNNIKDRTVGSADSYSHTWGRNACGCYSEGDYARTFLKYKELPAITSSDVVVSATISMYKPNVSSTVTPVNVHKVMGNWESETINWSNKPNYNTNIEDFAIVDAVDQYSWNITDIVRGWYDHGNTGMMFKSSDAVENGTTANFKEFYSSDYGSPTYSPSLYIVFRNNSGLESYWDYTTTSAGRAGTGYVNNYTGNLTWIREDMGFGGNRMPVTISHIYNLNDAISPVDSNNANDTNGNAFGLGKGWRTNFNQRIFYWYVPNEYDYYGWEDADGTDHYFYYDSETGEYKDEDGLELTLTVDGSEEETYCITDKVGNCSYFDKYGRLTKQTNNQETKSCIEITYEGQYYRIATITDGAGRVYRFSYNNNLLSSISYVGFGSSSLHSTSFTYSEEQLTRITDADDKACLYTYTPEGVLISAQNPNHYELTYAYYARSKDWQPYRVNSVTESDCSSNEDNRVDGGGFTFVYDHNQTTVTDCNGNKNILQFNDWGNTIAIQDNEGKAQYAEYATDSNENNKANQLMLSSKLQNTVVNLLEDSSFEKESLWTLSNSPSVDVVTSQAYHGYRALQVSSSVNEYSGVRGPGCSLPAGKTATFSAYVKTNTASALVSIFDGNNQTKGEVLEANSDWTRLEISYTNTSSTEKNIYPYILTPSTGTFWADCVQLEFAPTASRYNLVDNGDFRAPTVWDASAGRTTAPTAAPQLSNNVYQLSGTYTSNNRLSQKIFVKGSAGDAFVAAGWAKGNAVPIVDNREFGILVRFNYNDGTTSFSNPDTVANFKLHFNTDVENWQYVAAPVVAEKAYSSVTIILAYDYSANTVQFDGIQLFKEGFGTSYTYDEDGNVVSATDLQNTTKYKYQQNNLTRILLNDTEIAFYSYDNYHNVKSAVDQTGMVYSFSYDAYGNNTEIVASKGYICATVSAVYCNSGNYLYSTTDTFGKVTRYNYDPDTGVLLSVKAPEDTGNGTSYTYDALYRIKTAQQAADADTTLSVSYDYYGDVLSTIETASTTYNFTYGNFDLVKKLNVGSRNLVKYSYTTPNNLLKTLEYGNGDSVEYTYDTKGRLVEQTYEDGDFVTYRYDNDGALAMVEDSDSGTTTTHYYDLIGREVKYKESATGRNHIATYTYDSHNNFKNLAEKINDQLYTTRYFYDETDRLISVRQGDSKRDYTYDTYGRLESDEVSHGTTTVVENSYQYTNNTSRLSAHTVSAGGHSKTAEYAYDGNGNIISIESGNNTTTYVYDHANQLTRENNQAAGKTWVYTYDDAGNILSRKEYAYTTGTLGTVQDTVTYVYGDSNWGDLLTKYDGVRVTSDGIGNPLSLGLDTYTWEHGRELATSGEYTDFAVIRQPENYTGWIGEHATFSIEAVGEGLTYQWQVSANNGSTWYDSSAAGYNTPSMWVNLTADNAGNLYRCKVTDAAGNARVSEPGKIIKKPVYITRQPEDFYGSVGDRVEFSVEADGGNSTRYYQWQVSANDGATWYDSSAGGYNTPTMWVNLTANKDGYLYRCIVTDGVNNDVESEPGRIHVTALAVTKQPEPYTGTLGSRVEFSIEAHGTGLSYQWQVSTNNGTTWSNSSAGGYSTPSMWVNLTANNAGYLYRCKVTNSSGDVVYSEPGVIHPTRCVWEYTYNAEGLRIRRTNQATTYEYTYSGDKLTQMAVNGNTLYFAYDTAGTPVYLQRNSSRYFYVTNIQGDVIAILDVSGEAVVEYTYDAWGNVTVHYNEDEDYENISHTLGDLNPLRYRGYVYDQETGLYYVSSRYYDPEIGRFINADTTDILTATPMGLTDKNLFAYCDNNPVVRVDHGGQFWDTVFDVISLGASIVEVCVNPTDPWAWAGLAGDAIDLIPFVTGVGEVTRAVKTIDKVADTVQIAKAVDFTDDAADIVKTLDRSSGFTKSTASAGRKIHAGYKATDNFSSIGKEYRRINGIRPDYIDFNTRTIYELKPMNPRGVRSGIRQLQKYNKALGGGFNLRLELY